MTLLERAATRLNVVPEKLERESLRAYLERNLRLVESELYMLAQRYGVQTVEELDRPFSLGAFTKKILLKNSSVSTTWKMSGRPSGNFWSSCDHLARRPPAYCPN